MGDHSALGSQRARALHPSQARRTARRRASFTSDICFRRLGDLTIPQTTVDGTLQKDEGHFLLIDGRDMSRVVDIPPSVRRVRANRSKLRTLLIQGLDIEYEKRFSHYEVTEHGVRAHFTDGTASDGTFLVGCDGNNSAVRRQMLGAEKSALQPVGVAAFGGTRHLSLAMTQKLRAIDPLLFQTMNPGTGDYGAFSFLA